MDDGIRQHAQFGSAGFGCPACLRRAKLELPPWRQDVSEVVHARGRYLIGRGRLQANPVGQSLVQDIHIFDINIFDISISTL